MIIMSTCYWLDPEPNRCILSASTKIELGCWDNTHPAPLLAAGPPPLPCPHRCSAAIFCPDCGAESVVMAIIRNMPLFPCRSCGNNLNVPGSVDLTQHPHVLDAGRRIARSIREDGVPTWSRACSYRTAVKYTPGKALRAWFEVKKG